MAKLIVTCNHSSPPQDALSGSIKTLQINSTNPKQNLRLQIHNISHKLLMEIADASRDLIDIASYIYYADTSLNRGTTKDIFHNNWIRDLHFVIPVRKLGLWQDKAIKDKLISTLSFLTQDSYDFSFVEHKPELKQKIFTELNKALPYQEDADCVSLFSGGMDSLSGAVHLWANNRKPILVSHQSRSVLANTQRKLAGQLRDNFKSWSFPHLDIKINRIGTEAKDNTQRSRSFLFLSIGSVIAHELHINELMIYENGITSFNLPRLSQTIGAQASRSTHPKFIESFTNLISMVFDSNIQILNPFLWKTRAEVIDVLKDNGVSELLPISSSCNHSRRPKIHPHCGTCSQCVDRKFAVIYSGLNDQNYENSTFAKDIFVDSLDEGEEIMQVLSPVHFSLNVLNNDIDYFSKEYPQVFDAINSISDDHEDTLNKIYDLHKRFAREIKTVMGLKHGEFWDRRYKNELSPTCLLMMTGDKSTYPIDPTVSKNAQELIKKIRDCELSKAKPLEDICEEILIFLFCENLPKNQALSKPKSQSKTDVHYDIRDLLFENRASEGFWKDIRDDFDAHGVIVDAKNYKDEIDRDIVVNFESKYIKGYGTGRFGIICARKVPEETRNIVALNKRVPSAIKAQKDLFTKDPQKLIILLGEEDIINMLNMKASSQNPTDLLRERIFTLRERI